MRIEDYALIGDLQTAALVGRNGSIDWLCFPRFDSGACFAALLGDDEHGRWLLAPAGEVRATRAALPRRHARPRDRLPDRRRAASASSTSCRRAARTRTSSASSRASAGAVPMRMELVIRFDYGSIVPWVRRVDDDMRVAVAGPDAIALRDAGRAARREHARRSPSSRRGRRARAVRADLVPLAPRDARADRRRAGARGHVLVLARMGRQLHLRRPVARRGPPLADHAEGADLRSRPAASSPRRRRRCPSRSAASATGTTATAGCATRRSRSTPLVDAASSTRRAPGATGCCARSPATRTSCRSCTARPASGGCPSSSCRGSPATRARGRCGSATAPAASSSSTSTAR